MRNSYAVLEDEMTEDSAAERWSAIAGSVDKGLKEAVPKARKRKRKPG